MIINKVTFNWILLRFLFFIYLLFICIFKTQLIKWSYTMIILCKYQYKKSYLNIPYFYMYCAVFVTITNNQLLHFYTINYSITYFLDSMNHLMQNRLMNSLCHHFLKLVGKNIALSKLLNNILYSWLQFMSKNIKKKKKIKENKYHTRSKIPKLFTMRLIKKKTF